MPGQAVILVQAVSADDIFPQPILPPPWGLGPQGEELASEQTQANVCDISL